MATELARNSTWDCVLIDDDDLIHAMWKLSAAETGRNVYCLHSYEEFLQVAENIAPQTIIYIDMKLGEGRRGDEVARRLHHLGFHELFLATGLEPEELPIYPWVRGVVGKTPPWEG